ncbi:MAG: EAL domain-containing protein [Thermoanaerobaculia bacterium]
MAEPQDDRLRALQTRLDHALAENDLLAEQAEDILLLGRVAEALLEPVDEPTLVSTFLERVSILKDLPYCALFELQKDACVLRSEYPAFGRAGQIGAQLRIAREAVGRDAGTILDPALLTFSSNGFVPSAVMAVPFEVSGRAPSALVFADDRRGPESIRPLGPVLHEMARLVCSRLENLVLQSQLEAINVDLERKVAERTAALEQANRSLEAEIDEHRRAQVVLRQAAAAFEHTSEGVVITDATETILTVNRAFSKVTGYEAEEVIGKTPRMLQSGRHDRAFYNAMWIAIREDGHWQGEIWNRRKDGSIYPELLNVTAVRDEAGEITNYVAVFSDITMMKESEARFDYLAHYDALTDLPNRLLFLARFNNAAEHARKSGDRLGLMIVGIDGFKVLNETLGLAVGDELLRGLARLLRESVSERDTVARLAGDEFIILLSDVADSEGAGYAASRILGALQRPFHVEGRELFLTCSAGLSMFPDDGDDLATLQRNAHVAFHNAKESGRNTFQFCTPLMRAGAEERFALETDLRRAVHRKEFVLHFQPQFSLTTGAIVGVEALARWQHPERGLLHPKSFIAVAEETGVIEDLGTWALKEACTHAMKWREAGVPPFRMAVNLSPREIIRPALVTAVARALSESGLEPELLELEITESSLMAEPEQALRSLRSLKALGVRLAIDDFGTGYSSLSYLKVLPVDNLKIDQSFVRDIAQHGADEAIARAIIMLGHGLSLRVIAEGVETVEQADFLREHLCDEVQGYYYAMPLAAPQMLEFLRRASKAAG